MKSRVSALALVCAVSLAACGGGGGGGGSPAPAPPPAPAPAPPPADTTPPDTTLTSNTPALSNSASATFAAASTETGGTLEMSVDGGAFVVTNSVFTVSGLADGPHTVSARARDAAGNVDASPASFSWTIDTEAPDTAVSGGPPSPSFSNGATFTLTSPDTSATFEASVDGGAFAAATSPLSLSGLAIGAHTISVRALDAAGNIDASPATYAWTIQAPNVPTARIIFPGPAANTDAGTITIRGTTSNPVPIQDVDLRVRGSQLSFQATSTDNFATWSATIPVLQASSVTLDVVVTDANLHVNTAAASTTISNSGLAITDMRGLVFDPGRNRLLVPDLGRRAMLGVSAINGLAGEVSGPNVGTGTAIGPFLPVLDAPNNRLLTYYPDDTIVAMDLTTGNRSEIVSASVDPNYAIFYSYTVDNAQDAIYAAGTAGSIVRIDLDTGTRTYLTGFGTGTGPALNFPSTMHMDTSGVAVDPRLLVLDQGAIVQVDIATGNRSALPGGAALADIRDFVVDAANQRLLVLVPTSPTRLEIGVISLVNGATGGYSSSNFEVATSAGGAFITLDGTGANAYLGTMDRSRILRYNFASSTLSRFHDSLVGSGSAINSSSNLELDTTGATPVIYSGTQFPAAGVVKVDLATGVRSTVVMSDLAGPPTFATPTTLRIDRRPGAAANSMLLMDEGFIPPRLFSVDLAANTYDILFGTLFGGGGDIDRGWLLDAQLNRFVRGNFDGAAYELSALDVDTGIRATISGTGRGTGPAFVTINGVAIESVNGGTRYIVADSFTNSALLAVDPYSGNRSFISSNVGAVGTGPDLPYIADIDVDSATHRALVVGLDGTLQFVDLVTGNRTPLNGPGTDLIGDFLRVKADFASGIAYVRGHFTGNSIFAVDLVTGERAIISR